MADPRLLGAPAPTPNEVAEALTRKPITPASAELEQNPRSRSAKLRAIRKFAVA